MPVLEFLSPDSVVSSLRARTKKAMLQEISAHAVRQLPALDEREVFETLMQRERLGSTGIGDGVAIPHGKLPGLDRLFGLVARLEKPVDFDALDGQPVDIAFLLLYVDDIVLTAAPENVHLFDRASGRRLEWVADAPVADPAAHELVTA